MDDDEVDLPALAIAEVVHLHGVALRVLEQVAGLQEVQGHEVLQPGRPVGHEAPESQR